jgi:hypothetical protein
MQGRLLPSDAVPQQVLNGYELMVDAIAFSAKAYWAMWGPPCLPMIDAIDRWAERQRGYLQPLRNES